MAAAAPIQQPITGREPPGDPTQPIQALAQFYRAFNERDLPRMAENWHNSSEASMDNPLGASNAAGTKSGQSMSAFSIAPPRSTSSSTITPFIPSTMFSMRRAGSEDTCRLKTPCSIWLSEPRASFAAMVPDAGARSITTAPSKIPSSWLLTRPQSAEVFPAPINSPVRRHCSPRALVFQRPCIQAS
jgi:hypothetical protein